MKIKFVSGPLHHVEERVNKMLEEGWNIGEHGWFSQDLLRAAVMMVRDDCLQLNPIPDESFWEEMKKRVPEGGLGQGIPQDER